MIAVEGLAKTFHVHRKDAGLWGSIRSAFRRETIAKDAVKNVSFSVAEGEIVGLVGANGAGKTTVVKMLAGIVHPSAGDASVLGHRPWDRSAAFRRQIALIMGQKAQLWWDLPAADCFLLLKEIYEIPEDRFRKNLDYLTSILGIGEQQSIQIRRLSLGERMKMELVAALLHSPRVVFLDEPTIGLDLSAQRAIRDFLLAYREEHRPAMLLTSHYMEDIERLCKRILILREGELVFDGPLAQISRAFATHKIVTAHLELGAAAVSPAALIDAGVELVEHSADVLKLSVPREQVARVAAAILERFPVADLSIAEDEIGTVIEKIMTARGGETAP